MSKLYPVVPQLIVDKIVTMIKVRLFQGSIQALLDIVVEIIYAIHHEHVFVAYFYLMSLSFSLSILFGIKEK